MRKIYIFIVALALFSCTNEKKESSKNVNSTPSVSSVNTKKDTIANSNAAATSGKNAATDLKQTLAGEWKEHWGIGVQTNVNTTDLYKIIVAGDGKISIISANKKNYKIDQVLFDGQEISFRKQNKSYTLGKFYVYYKLKIHNDFNWMEGPITNNKKQKDFVKWERVKP